ncbi:MAG: DUF1592 domain-containing protein [Pirellulaceae bacterium]
MHTVRTSILLLTVLAIPLQAADTQQRAVELQSKIRPLLQTHCLDCHSGAEPDGGLTLDHFDSPLDFLKGRRVWEKAVQKMEIGEMPPADSSELSDADRKLMTEWITSTIDDYECGLAPNPGQVTLRRLNATEYQNTVRDLLGVNYTPAASFPGDDVGYGFDNIGDVLTLPPLLMEKYFIAAEQISRYVIKSPPPGKTFEAIYSGAQLGGAGSAQDGRRVLASNGDAIIQEQIPWAGRYLLTITASGDQAGNEPCLMSVAVDNKPVAKIIVKNERSEPKEFQVPLGLRAGKREITIGFLNDFYQPGENGQPTLDRNLSIHHVELTGSQSVTEKLDPKTLTQVQQLLALKQSKFPNDAASALREFLKPLVSRAYRRPVPDDELQQIVDLAASVAEDGGTVEEGAQVALQAVLISPKFLFRVEPPRSDASGASATVQALDEFELATRLSYFLWSTMPDNELLQLAWEQRLRQGDNLEKQVRRMIQDPRSNAFVENFAGQWLTLRKLRDFKPNERQFPRWNNTIKDLAQQETLTFFAGVMRNDLSIVRLLDADFTYLNEDLAKYYGVPNVTGSQFRQVSLKGTPRAGLLTQASVLAVTSNPTRTSPVKRGKWILENLLATPPPPAPPGVPELMEKGELAGSLRQRLEQHRADQACAGCHKLMDPLGFALENFDAVGQYRTSEAGQPVDATGELPGGKKVTGASQLRRVLATDNRDAFVECLTEKMLTYALGRGLEYYDKCAVDKITDKLATQDHRFSSLLIEIVKSDPFQKKGSRESE